METKKEKFLVGDRRSSGKSDLAVFESYKHWPEMRAMKVIPVGFYFVAGILSYRQRNKADLHPNIFVQGYRPHSSSGMFASDKRAYGAIWVGEMPELAAKDDVHLIEANVYRMVHGDDFELVLANKEWLDEEKVTAFMKRFREELGLEGLSGLKKFKYTCEKSRGYFLKGRTYEVWSQLVGRPEKSLELTKKVLIVDLHCGVPCVVDYAEENFSPIE